MLTGKGAYLSVFLVGVERVLEHAYQCGFTDELFLDGHPIQGCSSPFVAKLDFVTEWGNDVSVCKVAVHVKGEFQRAVRPLFSLKVGYDRVYFVAMLGLLQIVAQTSVAFSPGNL